MKEKKKGKLEEMSEGKSTRPSDDAMFLRSEIIDAIRGTDEKMETSFKNRRKDGHSCQKMEKYSKKTDEKMDNFLQTIDDSVGIQLHGMNTTIAKMKEDDGRMKKSRIWKNSPT